MTPTKQMTRACPPIKACAYGRSSSDPQDSSIFLQRDAILQFAKDNGYEITVWYEDEGISGGTNKRDEWMRLLSEAPSAEWEVVLCFTFNRFSRLDSFQATTAKQVLREAGKKLISIMEGEHDWDTPMGRMMSLFHDEEAHEFLRKLANNCLRGKLIVFNNGKPYGKMCPYGMARLITDPMRQERHVPRGQSFLVPKGWSHILIPGDTQEVETVRWLFHTFATKDLSMRSLALTLNRQGVRSAKGSKWNHNIVAHLLRNETYVGDTRLGKQQTGKYAYLEDGKVVQAKSGPRLRKTCEGLLRQDTHKGIIDRKTWDVVQAKIDRIVAGSRRFPHRRAHFLSGILVCGHCGKTLCANPNKGTKKAMIMTYGCRTAKVYGIDSGCHGWRIKEQDILPLVIHRLAEAVDMRLLQFTSARPPRPPKSTKEELASLKKELAELDRLLDDGSDKLLRKGYAEKLKRPLQAKMCQWEDRRSVLLQKVEQIAKPKQPAPTLEQELREWQRFFAANRQAICIQKSPPTGASFEKGLPFDAESFRESLQKYGCRVLCWWRQDSATRYWDVDRVRLLLGYTGQDDDDGAPSSGNGEGRAKKRAAPSGTNGILYVPVGAAAPIDVEFAAAEVFPQLSFKRIHPIIQEMAAKGATRGEIAARLKQENMKTRKGLPWTQRRVQAFCHKRRIMMNSYRPRYSLQEVLKWADAFHKRTGRWPNLNSGPISEAPGKTWGELNDYLRRGQWGLPRGRSLAVILAVKLGIRNRRNIPPLTEKQIERWARLHYKRTGRLPSYKSGPIPNGEETWANIDKALRYGKRGLRGQSSLALLKRLGRLQGFVTSRRA